MIFKIIGSMMCAEFIDFNDNTVYIFHDKICYSQKHVTNIYYFSVFYENTSTIVIDYIRSD